MKRCPKCEKIKSLSDFYERKKYRWESERYQAYCKECTLKRRAEWYQKTGKDILSKRQKEHRRANPEFYRAKRQRLHWQDKMRSIKVYGNKCECCGESQPKFLAIDHINGNGNAHRKLLGNKTIYAWLRQNNYPIGFRILCHNCNMAIAFWQICPHKL